MVRVRHKTPTLFKGQLYSLSFRGNDNLSEPVSRPMAQQYVGFAPAMLEIVELEIVLPAPVLPVDSGTSGMGIFAAPPARVPESSSTQPLASPSPEKPEPSPAPPKHHRAGPRK